MNFDHDDRSSGDMPEQYRPHFQGTARIQTFESPFERGPAVFAVHCDAGGRTKPHLHHTGQLLYVTDGEGIVANHEGRRHVHPGDVITVHRDEWHWHGATPDKPMTHLTVQMPGPDDIEWDVDEGDWAADYE